MRVTASVVVLSVLALGACHKREEKAEAPTSAQPPAATATAAPAGKPGEAPSFKRKPGLWEMQMSMGGIDFVQTAQTCVKAGEDDATAFNPQAQGENCRKHTVTRQLDGSWKFATQCDMGSGGKVALSGVASGDFDKRYQVRSEMKVTGAAVPQMNRTTTLNVDARRIGDC
ncbi:DUF3617 family protein [Caulobacter sp. 17J80-11]|uniref:DUF3617 domain-containing protein n=1 Tax=Caulobacter sp. 17J80-11 TaxID=2763502 RepID=UPI001653A0D4|nr:DUF3617 family protein [Caulobacter sp. 17J80-11]MBC6980424.1 DUF3617 family protein [Caulobacter sp. 17J80-11]